MAWLQSFAQHLFAPIDIASLVYFRIAFGAIMLWEVWRYFSKGWISRYWIDPVMNFTYYGFNHFYLICLISFLMIWMPAHRAFSVDAQQRPAIAAQVAPAWTLWLLRAQLGLVYFYAGVAKLNPDWLAGEPLRTWLAARTDFPVIGHLFTTEWMVYLLSYGG